MTNNELLQMQKMMGMPPAGNVAQAVPMQGYHQSGMNPDMNNTPMPVQNESNSGMSPMQFYQQQEIFQNMNKENNQPIQQPMQRTQDFAQSQEIPQNPSVPPVNDYMQEIANLRASQERMMQMMSSMSFQNPQQMQEQIVPQAPPDFLKNVDMDNVLSSKENFNQLLVSVYNQAISDAERTITPRITEVAQEQVSRKMETRQALDSFYARNPEFSDKKELIAMAVRHIRQRNMDIQDPGEILTKVESFLGIAPKNGNPAVMNQSVIPQNNMQNYNSAYVQSLNNGGGFGMNQTDDSQRNVIDSFVNYHLGNMGRA
jgi:hypothetical protein